MNYAAHFFALILPHKVQYIINIHLNERGGFVIE